MKSEANSGEEIEFDPYQDYGPTDGDHYIWGYLCFEHLRCHAEAAGYIGLVIKESLYAASREEKCTPANDLVSVGQCVLHELQVLRDSPLFYSIKEKGEEYHVGQVHYWLYEDLRMCGTWLLSQGLSLSDLVASMSIAREHLLDRLQKQVTFIMSAEGQLLITQDGSIEKKHKKLKSKIRAFIRARNRGTTPPKQTELSDAIRNLYGSAGELLFSEINSSRGLSARGRAERKKIMQYCAQGEEILRNHLVEMLQKYGVEPRYQVTARLMNALLLYPYYHIEKDAVSNKSKGAEKLRTQYRRTKRSKGIKNSIK